MCHSNDKGKQFRGDSSQIPILAYKEPMNFKSIQFMLGHFVYPK